MPIVVSRPSPPPNRAAITRRSLVRGLLALEISRRLSLEGLGLEGLLRHLFGPAVRLAGAGPG